MIGNGVILPWRLDPLDALRRWPRFRGRDRPVVMLHSGRLHPRWSRYAVLAEPTGAYRFTAAGRSEWLGPAIDCAVRGEWSHHPLTDLNAVLGDASAMWIGYLGYDVGRYIESLPQRAAADRNWPIVQMHRCPGWLVHDMLEKTWHACGTWRDANALPDLPTMPEQPGSFGAGEPSSVMSRSDYEQAVRRVKDYIAAGDVFQVNLTHRFTAPFTGDTRSVFAALAAASPAWYGAYLELLKGDPSEPQRTIASTSPELFLQVDADGHVTTRPIKGTRPATAAAAELRDSEKDTAELNMIVDLLRNDLGRVCRYGSVRVVEPRTIESHPTVHHGVSTIVGQLAEGRTLMDLLRATMPGGSITGAPKVRAMQIIDELEPVRRGPYCGAIGYVHGKEAALNIAIRTMLIEQSQAGGRVDFGVGGGIVADSEPAAEYQETLDKAAAVMAALGKSHR